MPQHGTPLSPGQQEAFLGAISRAAVAISHEIDPTAADSWVRNTEGLKQALRRELIPPASLASEGAVRLWVTLGPTTIKVNLDAAPKLPFSGAEVERHIGDGWAIVEKRSDGLYVSGRKVIQHLSKRQQNGKSLKGYELREELTGKPILNANLLDALYENTHLIPEDWKKDEQGNTRYIFFWGTIYRGSDGNLSVRYLFFNDGAWRRRYCRWLGRDWRGYDPAASLASPPVQAG